MESELLRMELNILYNVSIIVIILLLFSALYYFLLKYRYKKNRHLILAQHYLDQLFKKSSSSAEASQGSNGDISIETVTFLDEDFQFNEELNKLVQCFKQLTN